MNLRYYENGNHFASLHVVFYETRIRASELMEIMRYTDKKGYWKHEVHRLCDSNVYKLTSN